MKNLSIKRFISVVLSFMFCVSMIASIPFSAYAAYEAYFLDGSIATEATFILDPGHGGADPGALGPVEADGTRREEADANLEMALNVAKALEARGETVALTRITDKTVALIDRSHISNAGKYNIFCSLHRNSYSDPSAHGIGTFYFNGLTADAPSAKIASTVHKKIMSVSSDMYDRKVKSANFSVLRETYTCAILIESLFISSPSDNLLYDSIKDDLAVAIAEGLIESKKYAAPDYMLGGTYSPADLGDNFVAAITIPYADLALTNNGQLNTVASKIDYSTAQLWKFEKVDNRNAYKLTSLLDNKCLDVDSAKTTNEANVMVWDDNGLSCQKFYFYRVNDLYCIRPMHCTNDRVLDVNAVNLNTQIYDLILTNPNQQFQIVNEEDFSDDNSSGDTSDDDTSSDDSGKSGLVIKQDSKYVLNDSYIYNVEASTISSDFVSNFEYNVKVLDEEGVEVSETSKIGTGFTVFEEISNESATIIVLGDVDGDGIISTTDYMNIKLFFLSKLTLDGVYALAADVDQTNGVTTVDYIQLKSHLIGNINIYQ